MKAYIETHEGVISDTIDYTVDGKTFTIANTPKNWKALYAISTYQGNLRLSLPGGRRDRIDPEQ